MTPFSDNFNKFRMNTKYQNILSDSECLSQEQANAYLADNLSREEKYRIEQHLISCQLCRDEIEGLLLMNDKENLPKIIAQLNSKIEKRIKRENQSAILRIKKSPDFRIKRILAIAAAVVLLFSIGYFVRFSMLTKSDEQIAELTQNKSDEKSEFPINANKTEGEPILTKSPADKSELKSKKTVTLQNKSEIVSAKSNTPVEEYFKNALPHNEPDLNTNAISDVKEEIVTDNLTESEQATNDDMTNRSIGTGSEKSKKDIQSSSLSSTSPMVEEVTADYSKKSSKIESENAGELFLTAKDSFDSGKYKAAISMFRKVQTLDDYRLWEDAQWFEALSLLKNNNKREARKLLQKISTSNSRYKGDATDKLKEQE